MAIIKYYHLVSISKKRVAPKNKDAALPACKSKNGETVYFFCSHFPGINRKNHHDFLDCILYSAVLKSPTDCMNLYYYFVPFIPRIWYTKKDLNSEKERILKITVDVDYKKVYGLYRFACIIVDKYKGYYEIIKKYFKMAVYPAYKTAYKRFCSLYRFSCIVRRLGGVT